MKQLLKKPSLLLLGLLLGSMAALPVKADDIEIYTGLHGGAKINSNVLFILDSSGSMNSTNNGFGDNIMTRPAYSASATYTTLYNEAYYYWTFNGEVPSLSDTPTPAEANATENKILIANFHCQTGASVMANDGIYTDQFVAWRPADSQWLDLAPANAGTEDVECYNDQDASDSTTPDQHGEIGGTAADRYAVDGASGPWSASTADAVDWDVKGRYYTFYSGHYLNYRNGSTPVLTTRYNTMVSVLDELLKRISSVNVGLMWFDGGDGGYVVKEVVNIDKYSDRAAVLTALASGSAGGVTPLSETMYEAFQYYRGGTVHYGDKSVAASLVTGSNPAVYNSPITGECQKSYTVMLSDGTPVSDGGANSLIRGLPNFSTYNDGSGNCNDSGAFGNNCLDDLTNYMNYEDLDLHPSTPESNENIQTYTIGFANDIGLLKNAAEPGGGGEYYTASSSDELASAFADILGEVGSTAQSFSNPSVSVSAFNRAVNRNFIYMTQFEPSEAPRWEGNLKKYRLAINALGNIYITDSNEGTGGNQDIITIGGGIDISAKSYWPSPVNTGPDGNTTLSGGVRDRFDDPNSPTAVQRRVWTDLDTSVSLANANNAVSENNTAITKALMGIPTATDAYRDQVLMWARGVDVLDDDFFQTDNPSVGDGATGDSDITDSRRAIPDALHSQPIVVNYGGTAANPQQIIFFGTNDGYLHAINEATGEEIFSYIPNELLGRLTDLHENNITLERPYGLDGSPTVWVKDVDNDGVIERGDGDHVYLYIGMRRGGRNLYALDVTDANDTSPSATLLWKITGGTGDYAALGQTWSKPLVKKIKISISNTVVEKTILAIGGGYDVNQDNSNTADTMGNAIYFIDAETGERLWWASDSDSNADLQLTNMTHSIPSDLAVFDVNRDGLDDRIYVGDTAAQLWRFDIDNGEDASELVAGGLFAELGDFADNTSAIADQRRFFYPPSVANVGSAGGAYFAVAIGSGYRAHPLNDEIDDRIYMLKDSNAFSALTAANYSDLESVKESNLSDLTTAGSTELDDLGTTDGWMIRLLGTDNRGDTTEGEKVLAAPLIFDGSLIITTYTPNTEPDPCRPDNTGVGKVYFLSLTTAEPIFNYFTDGSDTEKWTPDDRAHILPNGGIPPGATYYVISQTDSEGNEVTSAGVGVGKTIFPGDAQVLNKTYWFGN